MTRREAPSATQLRKRFAARLNSALDGLGYPASAVARAARLAVVLNADSSYASSLLSGAEIPEWEVFARLCEACQKQPGYFLDWVPSQFPTDTELVKALGHGEALVLRMPPELVGALPTTIGDKHYVVAKHEMAHGIAKGDIVVIAPVSIGATPMKSGALYLIQTRRGFHVLECTDLQADVATLDPELQEQLATITLGVDRDGFPTRAGLDALGILSIGVVVASLKPANVLTTMPDGPARRRQKKTTPAKGVVSTEAKNRQSPASANMAPVSAEGSGEVVAAAPGSVRSA